MPENIKTRPASVKAIGEDDGLEPGVFDAVVSVFGNVDSYGDVVMPGAFQNSLEEWEASGDPIPVYWSHRMDDPDYNIGHVVEATETDKGLQVRVKMDLDGPKAQQVYRLLKGRRVTQFSFAYDVLDAAPAKRGDLDVLELRQLKVYEVGPTPIGANQETELIAVKSAGARARALAQRFKTAHPVELDRADDDALRATRDDLAAAAAELTEFLAANGGESTTHDPHETHETAATVHEPAGDEDPEPGKSFDPTRDTAASALAFLSVLSLSESE